MDIYNVVSMTFFSGICDARTVLIICCSCICSGEVACGPPIMPIGLAPVPTPGTFIVANDMLCRLFTSAKSKKLSRDGHVLIRASVGEKWLGI